MVKVVGIESRVRVYLCMYMKSLFFGIVLIILLGTGGFVYRNVMETTGGPMQKACTLEAKVCPDSSSVGRVAPSCEFAACPLPNIEIPTAQIAFMLPEGYVTDENAYGAEPTLIGAFIKPSLSDTISHTIMVRQLPILKEETSEDILIAHTRLQPSDLPVSSINQFDTLLVNGRTWHRIVIERFEGVVHSAYYLPREKDVIKVEVVEHDVTDWMEPSLNVETLPEHKNLLDLIATIQSP